MNYHSYLIRKEINSYILTFKKAKYPFNTIIFDFIANIFEELKYIL